MGWIIALIVGGVAGWLASMVMGRDASMGLFWNIIVGIIGSIIGNFVGGYFVLWRQYSGIFDYRFVYRLCWCGGSVADTEPHSARPGALIPAIQQEIYR